MEGHWNPIKERLGYLGLILAPKQAVASLPANGHIPSLSGWVRVPKGAHAYAVGGEMAVRMLLLPPGYNNTNHHQGYGDILEGWAGGPLIFSEDGIEHASVTKAIHPLFNERAMDVHIQHMDEVIRAAITQIKDGDILDFYSFAQSIAFRIAMKTILGVSDEAITQGLLAFYPTFLQGAIDFTQTSIPFLPYKKSKIARNNIDQITQEIIEQKRVFPSDDMLSMLLKARGDDGNTLPDKEILSLVRSFMFAGYETTVNTMSWFMHYLLENQKNIGTGDVSYLEKIHTQAYTLFARAPNPTYADLKECTIIAGGMDDALRLRPQVPTLPRGIVNEDIVIGGVTIHAGDIVLIVPSDHWNPKFFADPDTWNPERDAEYHAHPYAFIGFGAGPRGCIGEQFAKAEAKLLFSHLLTMFDITAVYSSVRSFPTPLSRPTEKLWKRELLIQFHR